MQKKIQLKLDSQLLSEATTVFDYYGLDMQTGIKMFLKRVATDKTVSFLFGHSDQISDKLQSKDDAACEVAGTTDKRIKMTKNNAIRLFGYHGSMIAKNVTFASKNKSANNYWANPTFGILSEDWSLILNDNIRRKLYLFYIPAHTIAESQLKPRADAPALIDLQIMYDDITFTDNRSGFIFSKYLTDEIQY